MDRTIKILAISGGGVGGIIPATILEYLEKTLNKPAHKMFDIIAGTSTGAILGASLCLPPKPLFAHQAKNFYFKETPQIFDRSLWRKISSLAGYIDERFDDFNLNQSLSRYFKDIKLSDITATNFMAMAYEIENMKPFTFRN
jgi:uncharacterized protein